MTAATGRAVGAWQGAWLLVEAYWTWYQRYWTATLFSTMVYPLLFLLTMGVGVGSQVQAGPATGGVSYLHYIAPTVLVAGSMQQGVADSGYRVLSGFKMQRDYVAVTATPVTPGQILGGHILWNSILLTLTGAVYATVAALFGAWSNPGVVVVVLVGTLTGLACATPTAALAAKTFDEGGRFALLFRFLVLPMTLLAGTFFPIGSLPLVLRWLAWVFPLWHGNQLAHAATIGGVGGWAVTGHLAYLCAVFALGWVAAHRFFYQRLVY
ncbi:ABC transporter permease [Nocardia sp. ET3-3]|uniref:Transport permease protein n=1 Tax=Nocardia terrae TaxID=2675851 RepID=A0A7K1V181_9NOCA|nr:ABC transporter permease [Nocardia terrae]MVU80334.1 ABC transporter permease [Nocardia terrae]